MNNFFIGEICILNEYAEKGLPSRIGERVVILEECFSSPNYHFIIEFDDGEKAPVKFTELNKATDGELRIMNTVFTGNKVEYGVWGTVEIVKVDYLNKKAEVKFNDDSHTVVDIDRLIEDDTLPVIDFKKEEKGKFTQIALEIGQFTDMKNKQYGSSVNATQKMVEVLMERYTYDEENYLMPKSLLKHILLTVRVMDKQNRIFNNPSGEGDSESPWTDITGYGLIGIDMVQK